MTRVPGWHRQFRLPWRSKAQIERDVDDELAFHLDARTQALVDEGLDPVSARRQAIREFGDVAEARRRLHDLGRRNESRSRRVLLLDELRQDLRFALRGLARNPGFTATALLVLALAIGANSAIFSLVNTVLLRPLVLERPEEITGVYHKETSRPDSFRAFSYPDYVDLRERATVFESLAAFKPILAGITEDETTKRVFGQAVSSNYFATLGVPPRLGRVFTVAEEVPKSAPRVTVISFGLWRRRDFDPDVLGQTITVNGEEFTIVGVTRQGFQGISALIETDVWFPMGDLGDAIGDFLALPEGDLTDRASHDLMMLGRLAPNLTAEEAEARLAVLSEQMAAEHPAENENFTVVLAPTSRASLSNRPQTDTPLLAGSGLLMGMAGVVLLIACLNLANMLLARGGTRRTEIALRQSLGGGRGRIVRQLLTEGFVLSLGGGALGLLIALWTTNLLTSSLVDLLPFGNFDLAIGLDARVVAATVAFCALSTLLFGLGPALKLVRSDLVADLKVDSSSRGGGALTRLIPRNTLVVAQMSLSLALLTAAGLFVRGALEARRTDLGFDLAGAVIVELDTTYAGYDEIRTRQVYERLLERIRALPGVEAAALTSNLPLSGIGDGAVVRRRNTENPPVAGAEKYIVGRDYFASLASPLLRGRGFTDLEERSENSPAVAVIDQTLADSLWPNEEPIGQIADLLLDRDLPPAPIEIVGIAAPLRHELFRRQVGPHLYLPYGHNYQPQMHLQVRLASTSEAAESAALETLRTEIRATDDRLPVMAMKTFRTHRDRSVEMWAVKAGANVFSLLGAVAVLLAVIGVYGVKAYVASQRRREIGIRMALGASPREVLWMMLREGLALTAIGLAIGLGLAFVVGQLLSNMLFDVSATDPTTFVVAPLLLTAAAALAAYLPSRRATRVAPTVALRHE